MLEEERRELRKKGGMIKRERIILDRKRGRHSGSKSVGGPRNGRTFSSAEGKRRVTLHLGGIWARRGEKTCLCRNSQGRLPD